MSSQYGPWASSIDAGGNPQLSTFWHRRLTLLVPTSKTNASLSRRNLLWLGAATLAVLLSPTLCLTRAIADEEKPGVLVYQVEPASLDVKVTAQDMKTLMRIVERRLVVGSEKLATVRAIDNGRIEVALARLDDATRKRAKSLLSHPGMLEFRILANMRDNKELIERAKKDDSKDEIRDSAGNRLVWWVRVRKSEVQSILPYKDIAFRAKKKAGGETIEVLVLPDEQNVTGDYLKQVEAAKDPSGQSVLRFTFNQKGGELFHKLTSTHLPDTVDPANSSYKLGMILDGELFSSPRIMSAISDHGEITGAFTEQEVADLANILSIGRLPSQLRLVEKASP